MPKFELVSVEEATLKAATGKRAQITREYLAYIGQLEPGRAGRLQAAEGETLPAVRRRLAAAARLAGKELVIKRAGDQVYFWEVHEKRAGGGRRRGRQRKEPASEA